MASPSPFAPQPTPIVEPCDWKLSQVQAVLSRHKDKKIRFTFNAGETVTSEAFRPANVARNNPRVQEHVEAVRIDDSFRGFYVYGGSSHSPALLFTLVEGTSDEVVETLYEKGVGRLILAGLHLVFPARINHPAGDLVIVDEHFAVHGRVLSEISVTSDPCFHLIDRIRSICMCTEGCQHHGDFCLSDVARNVVAFANHTWTDEDDVRPQETPKEEFLSLIRDVFCEGGNLPPGACSILNPTRLTFNAGTEEMPEQPATTKETTTNDDVNFGSGEFVHFTSYGGGYNCRASLFSQSKEREVVKTSVDTGCVNIKIDWLVVTFPSNARSGGERIDIDKGHVVYGKTIKRLSIRRPILMLGETLKNK